MHLTKPFFVAAAILGALTLTACAKKPPGCADPQTLGVIRDIVLESVREQGKPLEATRLLEQNVGGHAAHFLEAMKVSLVDAVSDGYDDGARKFTCRGTLKVENSIREHTIQNISYTTQATADDSGRFKVEVERMRPLGQMVAQDLVGHVYMKLTQGSWDGEYSCGALDGSDNPLAGPFSMPVSMEVKGVDALLERTTKAGGIEQLKGKVELLDSMVIHGTGKNSPDDVWHTKFFGKVDGTVWKAEGETTLPTGEVLRKCTLTLNLPTNQ